MGCQLGIPPPFRRNADILPSASCKPQSYQGGRGRFGWGPCVQQKPGSAFETQLESLTGRCCCWLNPIQEKQLCQQGVRDPKIGPNISQKMPTMLPLQIAKFQILGYELLGYMQNSSETYSKISQINIPKYSKINIPTYPKINSKIVQNKYSKISQNKYSKIFQNKYSKISQNKYSKIVQNIMMKWWNSWRSPSAERSRRAPGAPPSTLWTERPRSGAQANFYRS